jgi:hypothetical protein
MRKIHTMRFILAAALAVPAAGSALATNCGPHDVQRDGNCIHVQGAAPASSRQVDIRQSGSFSGSFGSVRVHPGANATIAGSTDDLTIQRGGAVVFSGNSKSVRVEGRAELSGNLGRVTVAEGASAMISGVATEVTGPGKVEVRPGSVIGGAVVEGQDPAGRDGMPRRYGR